MVLPDHIHGDQVLPDHIHGDQVLPDQQEILTPYLLDETDRHILTLAIIALCAVSEGERNTIDFYTNVKRVARKLGLQSDLLNIITTAQATEEL